MTPRLLAMLAAVLAAVLASPASAEPMRFPPYVPGPTLSVGNYGAIYGLNAPFALLGADGRTSYLVGWKADSYVAGVGVYALGRFELSIGRAPLTFHGAFPAGGLLFSDSSAPLDVVQLRFVRSQSFGFTKIVGWLDEGRSLVASQMHLRPAENLILAFNEVILMEGAPFLPYLLSPVPLFNQYISQQYRGYLENHLFSFTFDWLYQRRLRFFGEVMVDDFTVPTPTADFPSRWGLTVGMEHYGRAGRLQMVYSRVPNWTYSSVNPALHYRLRGRPLGHPLGADFDALHLRWAPTGRREYWATLIRKGEGQVGRIWADEAEARAFQFLRGTIEQSLLIGMDRHFYHMKTDSRASVSPWVAYRTNAGHVPGAVRVDWGVGLEFTRYLLASPR